MPGDLPIVDLEGGGVELANRAPDALQRVAQKLDAAFCDTGFCYITHCGVPPATTAGAFEASRRFHALDDETKRALTINEAHRGYIAPKSSLIATSSVANVTHPNLSESFMVMHEVARDDPRYGHELHGPNQWPALDGFRSAVVAYDTAMGRLARHLTALISVALGLDADALEPHFRRPTTWLRLLHYPPPPADAPSAQFGSAPHTDYGFITILAQDEHGGLEVKHRDGRWLQARPMPGTFIVNVADMLERFSNGRWRSTPHRVRNGSGTDRYSVPYFYDTDLDCEVAPLVDATDGARAVPAEPVRYGDYVMSRLNRNYAYRQRS